MKCPACKNEDGGFFLCPNCGREHRGAYMLNLWLSVGLTVGMMALVCVVVLYRLAIGQGAVTRH